ncbi:hypothetical protein A5844_002180 [Enterococcus sp. 10A9_DIV0425]|uniref:WxL domain-containing protein n=1 Tax=Candidatus Enterococcus wittei TaxID=1987383 RepID=A0A242JZ34_9ENTE|nr:BspA family leucine-rich repeat surface protein [Enterococcus sp. 10A9_DIV0425]OTP10480.1 hypothetical protein A5844_002180 [Enterococcus sp. 10A9_DIV0425]
MKNLVRFCSTIILGSQVLVATDVLAKTDSSIDIQAMRQFSEEEQKNILNQLSPIENRQNKNSNLQKDLVTIPEPATAQTMYHSMTQSSNQENHQLDSMSNSSDIPTNTTENSNDVVSDSSEVTKDTTEETNNAVSDSSDIPTDTTEDSNSVTSETFAQKVEGESDKASGNAKTEKPKRLSDRTVPSSNTKAIDGWRYREEEGHAIIEWYEGSDTDIVIPDRLNNLPTKLEVLDGYMFFNNEEVTSIRLAGTVGLVETTLDFQDSEGGFDRTRLPKLETLDLRGLDVSNITSMINLFKFSNAKTINITGWDTSKLTNMSGLFWATNKLETVLGLETLNTSQVVNMDFMFAGSNVKNLTGLENWNVSNVEEASLMFSEAHKLEYLNLSNWKLLKLKKADQIFRGTANLSVLDLTNWEVSEGFKNSIEPLDPGNAGYLVPLMVLTNNDLVLDKINGFPQRRPRQLNLDANGGQFSGNVSKVYYFTLAIKPDRLNMDLVKEFAQQNHPTKSGATFENWLDDKGNLLENVTDIFSILDTTFKAQWNRVAGPNAPGGSFKPLPDSTSKLGLYYLPNKFSIPTTQLNNKGEQVIPLVDGNNFHIGIKDQQSNSSWQLNAQLVWQTPGLDSSYIQSKNANGQVHKNKNDGQSAVQDTDFELTTEVTGQTNLQIGETEVAVMQGGQGARDAVYDYALGQAELVLPEVKNVQANQYTGNVNWNLIKAP